MNDVAAAQARQVFYDDVSVGTEIPPRDYGPHDLVTAVFWAGVQENPGLLHLDREHARAKRGAKSIVASGALRQSFLVRMVLDWAGPRAFLRTMTIRHVASTYEGDMQRYTLSVAGKSPDPDDPWVALEADGRNQDGEQIVRAKCTVLLPLRAWPLTRRTWTTG